MLGLNSGLIGVRRVPTQNSASGLWVPNEQNLAQRALIWPAVTTVNTQRYFRLANFAATALDAETLDFGEIEVYNQDTKHTGITCTTSFSWTYGDSSKLVDGIASASGLYRAYFSGWSSIRSTATITLDLGSTKTVTHIKIFSLFTQPRFPASFDLQSSSDNVTYTKVSTVTVGTSFTDLGGSVYSSAKVAVL